jgi:hypothetical protein
MKIFNSSRKEHYVTLLETAVIRIVKMSSNANDIYANVENYLNRLKNNSVVRSWSNLTIQHAIFPHSGTSIDIQFDINIEGKDYPVSISC